MGVLKFTAEALAGIFSGRIRKWNDPELTRVNPDKNLLAVNILVAHRADASGTTFAFTDYLSQVSEPWKKQMGRGATMRWPTGESARGMAALAELVKKTPYSIGYVELNFAIEKQLTYGEVRNAAGKFLKPEYRAVGRAAEAAQDMKTDFRASIVNSRDEGAYPICSFTWLLVPSQIADPDKRRAMKEFLRWIYGEEGQKIALTTDYGVLQPPLLDFVRAHEARIR